MRLSKISPPKQTRENTTTFYGLDTRERIGEGFMGDEENLSCRDYPVLSSRAVRHRKLTGGQDMAGIVSNNGIYGVCGDHTTSSYGLWAVDDGVWPTRYACDLPADKRIDVAWSETEPSEPSAGDYWFRYSVGTCFRYAGADAGWEPCAYPAKQLVAMGPHILVLPDGVWYNTADWSHGIFSDEKTNTPTSSHKIAYVTMVKWPGTANIEQINANKLQESATRPASPLNGTQWVNTSVYPRVLWMYDVIDGWIKADKTYIRIEFDVSVGDVIPAGVTDGSTVTFDGLAAGSSEAQGVKDTISALNGKVTAKYVGGAWFTIEAPPLGATRYQSSGTVKISKKIPDMDFVCEAGNRLWGCKFGTVGTGANAKVVNEIYASKLGSFEEWEDFSGLSTDSWVASVGAAGAWTGCASWQGTPVFFKEDRIFKVGISAYGAHTITEVVAPGVQSGCERSLAEANGLLYYKGKMGIYAYDGSFPSLVSEALGYHPRVGAVGGSVGKYYYVSMVDVNSPALDSRSYVYCYDSAKGLWSREDNNTAVGFATVGQCLFMQEWDQGEALPNETGAAVCECVGSRFDSQDPQCDIEGVKSIKWSFTTGVLGFASPDNKYTSRYDFRMKLTDAVGGPTIRHGDHQGPRRIPASVTVYIEYDSSGEWVEQGTFKPGSAAGQIRTHVVPVRPRRCDHFRVKLVGIGEMKLYGIARILEGGTDV